MVRLPLRRHKVFKVHTELLGSISAGQWNLGVDDNGHSVLNVKVAAESVGEFIE